MTQVKLDDVEVPSDLLDLLARSRLSGRDKAGQIRVALAIHLFVVGDISLGKAAELSGETRPGFENLLLELDVPIVQYGEEEFRQDMAALEKLKKQKKSA